MHTVKLLPLFLSMALLVSSCRKDVSDSLQSAEDNAAFESEYAQMYDVVTNFLATDSRTGKTEDQILPSGANVWFNDTTFTDGDGIALVLDYGPLNNGSDKKGVPCKDGRYRAGRIHVSADRPWHESPVTNVLIAASDEYYIGNGVKMFKLTGNKTITRTGTTEYTVEITNATLQRDNGTATWASNRTYNLTRDNSPGWYNDEYQVSGNASGTNANGVTYAVVNQSPLKKRLSDDCIGTFISGKLLLTNSNGKKLELNYDSYGNEACDKDVTVTIDGKTHIVQVW